MSNKVHMITFHVIPTGFVTRISLALCYRWRQEFLKFQPEDPRNQAFLARIDELVSEFNQALQSVTVLLDGAGPAEKSAFVKQAITKMPKLSTRLADRLHFLWREYQDGCDWPPAINDCKDIHRYELWYKIESSIETIVEDYSSEDSEDMTSVSVDSALVTMRCMVVAIILILGDIFSSITLILKEGIFLTGEYGWMHLKDHTDKHKVLLLSRVPRLTNSKPYSFERTSLACSQSFSGLCSE